MVHCYGQKLWLLWPLTETNMEFYRDFFSQIAPPQFTIDCIHWLQGLQIYYIDNKYLVFVLPPNYLHTVITIEAFAHAGINFLDPAHFSEFSRIIKWFLNWAKNCSHYRHTANDSLTFTRQVLIEGVAH